MQKCSKEENQEKYISVFLSVIEDCSDGHTAHESFSEHHLIALSALSRYFNLTTPPVPSVTQLSEAIGKYHLQNAFILEHVTVK